MTQETERTLVQICVSPDCLPYVTETGIGKARLRLSSVTRSPSNALGGSWKCQLSLEFQVWFAKEAGGCRMFTGQAVWAGGPQSSDGGHLIWPWDQVRPLGVQRYKRRT